VTELQYHANTKILNDTPIPNKIKELKNFFYQYGMQLDNLAFLQEERQGWINGHERVPQEVDDKIKEVAIALDKTISTIESYIKQLLDLAHEA